MLRFGYHKDLYVQNLAYYIKWLWFSVILIHKIAENEVLNKIWSIINSVQYAEYSLVI